MVKNILYLTLFLLAIYFGYWLAKLEPAEEVLSDAESPIVEVGPEEAINEPAEEVTVTTNDLDEVVLEGIFISLVEGVSNEGRADLQRPFYYMLIDDGTEIVRVDLRPILGYAPVDPIAKLGFDRGAQVVATGRMDASGFAVTSIVAEE